MHHMCVHNTVHTWSDFTFLLFPTALVGSIQSSSSSSPPPPSWSSRISLSFNIKQARWEPSLQLIYSTLKYKRKFFILIFVLINLRVYLICWICESAACYSAWVSTHSHALFEMRGKPGCGKISLTIWTHALALLLQGRHTRSGRHSLTEYVHSCKGNWDGFKKNWIFLGGQI